MCPPTEGSKVQAMSINDALDAELSKLHQTIVGQIQGAYLFFFMQFKVDVAWFLAKF